MHCALVGEDLFETVQKEIRVKRRYDKTDFVNLFSGKIFCADCGKPMHISGAVKTKHAYTCSAYKRYGKEACSMHYVSFKTMNKIVLDAIREDIAIIDIDEQHFAKMLQKEVGKNSDDKRSTLKKSIVKSQKRAQELDAIMRKLYEDNALGKISDERFLSMNVGFEDEQQSLTNQLLTAKADNTEKFLSTIRKYKDLTELSEAIVIELICKIIVHEGTWQDGTTSQFLSGSRDGQGNRTQIIEIHYNFVDTQKTVISKTSVSNQYLIAREPQLTLAS